MTEPTIGEVRTASMWQVKVSVSDAEILHGFIVTKGTRAVDQYPFRPDEVELLWQNGYLTRVQVYGLALRTDGQYYLDHRRAGCSFMARQKLAGRDRYKLSSDAPEWVRRLVQQHWPVLMQLPNAAAVSQT
jgi:hypothetical protein